MGGCFYTSQMNKKSFLLELHFEEKFIKFKQVQCFLSCFLFQIVLLFVLSSHASS